MRFLHVWLAFVLMGCLSVWADDAFDDVQILERDEARIKATGDLRGGEKLMQVVVRLRDGDMLIAGNDYRYAHLTIIPYQAIQSLTYSVIGDHLPDNLHRGAPLFQETFDGKDQRWFSIVYDHQGETTSVLLMLSRDTDQFFLQMLAKRSQKDIVQYFDGMPRQGDDVIFRKCRVFRTVRDDKGKAKTDDYACMVMMRDTAFEIVGQDKNYQDQIVLPYDSVRGLFYEHSKETSFVGRMPGIGAFRKAKHWFVIEGAETTALILDSEIVADFREGAQAKTQVSINAYGGGLQKPAQALVLPEELGGGKDVTTLEVLMLAKRIRCLLGPGTRALWQAGKLDRDGNARYDDQMPELVFEAIDLQAQTAVLQLGDTKMDVRVVASEMGLTFLSVENATLVTTVFARSDGQLVCVHSHHVAGEQPQAGQFYGVAEVLEKN